MNQYDKDRDSNKLTCDCIEVKSNEHVLTSLGDICWLKYYLRLSRVTGPFDCIYFFFMDCPAISRFFFYQNKGDFFP